MGVETVGAAQMVDAVVDPLSVEAVLAVACHCIKLVGGQQRVVKIDLSNVLALNDDVHIVIADVDVVVLVIEGGEGNLVDALLDGRNPHHRRGAVAPAV